MVFTKGVVFPLFSFDGFPNYLLLGQGEHLHTVMHVGSVCLSRNVPMSEICSIHLIVLPMGNTLEVYKCGTSAVYYRPGSSFGVREVELIEIRSF